MDAWVPCSQLHVVSNYLSTNSSNIVLHRHDALCSTPPPPLPTNMYTFTTRPTAKTPDLKTVCLKSTAPSLHAQLGKFHPSTPHLP